MLLASQNPLITTKLSKLYYMPANRYYSTKMKSWLKKENFDFDVTISSFDGAEVYES